MTFDTPDLPMNIDELETAFAESNKGSFPVPAGTYRCHIIDGRPAVARTGTPSYRLSFEVCEGEHVGQWFFHNIWLTPAALRKSALDLRKLGFATVTELYRRPLPGNLFALVTVDMRDDQNGEPRNEVKKFQIIAGQAISKTDQEAEDSVPF